LVWRYFTKIEYYIGYILLLIRAVACLWLFELGYVLLNLLISGNILLFYVQLHGITNLWLFETGDALVILRHVLRSGAAQIFFCCQQIIISLCHNFT